MCFQYFEGVVDLVSVNFDLWEFDQCYFEFFGCDQVMFDLFFDYQSNVVLYLYWQEYLCVVWLLVLLVWGQNDCFFLFEGVWVYLCDLFDVELYLFDIGYFVMVMYNEEIVWFVVVFFDCYVVVINLLLQDFVKGIMELMD